MFRALDQKAARVLIWMWNLLYIWQASRSIDVKASARVAGSMAWVGLALLFAAPVVAAPPVVSNVLAKPLSSGRVKITYDLADADTASLAVSVAVSTDGGATYSTIPSPSSLSGAVGGSVSRGTGKQIIWTSCLTFPGRTGGSYRTGGGSVSGSLSQNWERDGERAVRYVPRP